MGKKTGCVVKKSTLIDKENVEEVSRLFEQLMGTSDADIDVIIPKMLDLKKQIVRYCKSLNIIISYSDLKSLFNEYGWNEQITDYINSIKSDMNIDITKDYSKQDINQLIELKQQSSEKVNDEYKCLKNHQLVKQIVVTCNNIDRHRNNFENKVEIEEPDEKKKKMSAKNNKKKSQEKNEDDESGKKYNYVKKDKFEDIFIRSEPGNELRPLEFSDLDLKILWFAEILDDKSKNIILGVLYHLLIIGREIYKIISSPDIDIAKFSAILVQSICELKKQIPRCDKAFEIIENSVKMLEDNFTTYYRSSMEADNPNNIGLDFISDVSKKQNVGPVVMAQFHRIMTVLRERSANITDPRAKKVLNVVSNILPDMSSQEVNNVKDVEDNKEQYEPEDA